MEPEDDRELSRRVAESYRRVGALDDGGKARLMERLRREPREPRDPRDPREPKARTEPPAWRRASWRWQPVGVGLAVAASLAIGTALGWTLHERMPSTPSAALTPGIGEVSSTHEVRLVQFVLSAPKASHVTVVGDFNAWDPVATPMIRRDGGPWTAAIPVAPGRHVYAFIVDGDRWVSDPAAPMAPEDGFGIRNSVIVVGGQEST